MYKSHLSKRALSLVAVCFLAAAAPLIPKSVRSIWPISATTTLDHKYALPLATAFQQTPLVIERRGYWVYITTPATVDRPLIGTVELAREKTGIVTGNLFLDVEDQKWKKGRMLRFDVDGINIRPGELNIRLWVFLPREHEDAPPAGPKVLEGKLIKRLDQNRIIWAGVLTLTNKQALISRLDPAALKQAGLSTLPEQLTFEMIGFRHLYVGLGEVGMEPTGAKATWPSQRDTEAQEWLKVNGIGFEKGYNWDDDHVWSLELPSFSQNLTIYQMLRSGIFDEVTREIIGAGPGQAYSMTCMQSAVFGHLPESAITAQEDLAFLSKFIADLASRPQFNGTRFSDPVVVRTHRLRFSIIGPSPAVSKGPRGYWDHFVLEVALYRQFGQPVGSMTVDLSMETAERAKGPAQVEPPAERFEPTYDDTSPVLTTIGTALGSRLGAISQGLVN